MKRSSFSLLLITIFIASVSFANDKDKKPLKEKIENILQWEALHGFSGSVMVVKDGKIILNKGYGYANKKMALPNTSQTVYYIASVTKPITALAVMKLVEEKKIKLQDPLTKYFKGVPDNKKGITIEMLLTHESGMKQTYSCDKIADRDLAIETILTKTPMVSEPGVKYNYSGDGYSLLAALIEIVTGEKYERYVTRNIFEPAGIKSPAFVGDLQLLNMEDIASPVFESNFKSLRDIKSTWGNKGRAGMILSIEDMYKLDQALVKNKLLSASITNETLSPKIESSTGYNYGYGFEVNNTIRGTKMFGHGGDDDAIGHNFSYMHFPEENIKIFIGSNSGLYGNTSWSTVIASLLQRFLFSSNYDYSDDKLFHTEFLRLPVESLEKFEGVYQSGSSSYQVFLHNEKQLILCPIGTDVASQFGFSEIYSSKNELTRMIIQQTYAKQYDLLEANCRDKESFERLKKTIAGIWESLEKRNGPLSGIEIMGTANVYGGNFQADIATWVKLVFKSRTQLYRLEWDANNKIAGLGGSGIPYPMIFTLNPFAKKEFVGYDAANGRSVSVNFLSLDKDNKPVLELNISGNKPMRLLNTGNPDALPKRSAAEFLYNTISTKGIEATLEAVKEIKEKKANRFNADEDELNDVGYRLLKENKLNEAVTIFTILVQVFPESANGYDSLGEAYLKAGNKAEALKNYKRSVELNPKNENAKKVISDLEK